MKVVEKLAGFPQTAPRLSGLALEALGVLETITPDKPVLVVSPEATNVAAVKRAFVAAAKSINRQVDARNGEDGMVLVRLSSSLNTATPRRATSQQEHSSSAIEAEMKRLYVAAGNKEANFGKVSPDARRKLSIS